MALMLGACGRKEAPPAQTPAPAAATASAPNPSAARVYTVGTDAAYPPFEGLNDKGDIVGFDVEVIQAVAGKAGFEIRYVNTPWQEIFDALERGDRDMLVSAITITAERRRTMDFSAPYFDARQMIVMNPRRKVAGLADLKSLRVGVQIGTNGDEAVTRLMDGAGDRIRRFESTQLALQSLESGAVDGVVADNGVVLHHMASHADCRLAASSDPQFAVHHYGIALKKGNDELRRRINGALASIRADGSYEAIRAKYFGQTSTTALVAPTAPTAPR